MYRPYLYRRDHRLERRRQMVARRPSEFDADLYRHRQQPVCSRIMTVRSDARRSEMTAFA